MSKLEKLTVPQLKEILVENGLDESSIVGTGKNGRLLKEDIVNAIYNFWEQEDIYDPRMRTKPVPKPKSKTAGLKAGDWVMYQDDNGIEYKAVVEAVTASTKANIRPLRYLTPEINSDKIINVNRKYLTMIEADKPAKDVIVTVGQGNKSMSFAVKTDNHDEFDKLTDAISRLFRDNGIIFEQL